MSGEGIFDIHCHIVPGVDDGAADTGETRKLLQMEYDQGVRNIILTPHFRFQMFETPLEKIKRQFELAEGIDQRKQNHPSGLQICRTPCRFRAI